MKSNPSILWDVISCRLVEIYQHFGRNVLLPSSSKSLLFLSTTCLLSSLVDPDDRGSTFSRNVYKLLPDYAAQIQEYRGDRRNGGHNFIVNISTLRMFSKVFTGLVLMHESESEIYFHEQRTACKSLVGRFCVIHRTVQIQPQVTTASLSH